MGAIFKIIGVIAGGAIALVGLGWLGLRVQPAPFPAWPEHTAIPATVPIPDGLPAPVDRYYRMLYSDGVPVVETAVVTGRGELRIAGLWLPARYRFTHRAGRDYHHSFETTIYGWPILKVNESYLDGHARMDLPGGVVENDAKTDQAANLALWAEAMCFPSLYLTDARVRWEPIDGQTARLVVPFGAGEDAFTARFDPATGRLTALEALRWKSPDSAAPTGWRAEASAWARFDGQWLPSRLALTWADDDAPWAIFTVEEVAYNVDVAASLRGAGR
jgi:hypothetical protein